MKGVVFVNFAEFVESTWGLAFWDEVLEAVQPESNGAYTTVATYPDEELIQLITYICESQSISAEDAQRTFGRWLFAKLHAIAPPQAHQFKDAFTFLRGVQDVIHVEVKKLNEDAILPEFRFLEETHNSLTLEYISPRNLCFFCEGLILGLGDFIGQPLDVVHCETASNANNPCILKVVKQ
jgi:hypothetical protein